MKVRETRKILKLRKRKLPRDSFRLSFLIRPLVIILTSLIIAGIYSIGEETFNFSLREGDIAMRDVFAPFDFQYRVGVDKEKTQKAKEHAKKEAGEIYHINESVADVILEKLNKIFSYSLSAIEETPALPEELLLLIPQKINFKNLLLLRQYDLSKSIEDVSIFLEEFYKSSYVIQDSDFERFSYSDAKYLIIKKNDIEDNSGYVQLSFNNSRIRPLSRAREIVGTELRRKIKSRVKDVIIDLIIWNMEPNLVFSLEETEIRQDKAAENIENVYLYNDVRKHEGIISKGNRVTEEDLVRLKQISQRYGNEKLPAIIGIFLFSLIFLFLITLSYKHFNPKFYKDVSKLILVSLVVIITVALTKAVILSPVPSYLIPVALGPMLISVLISFPVAVKVTIFVAIINGIIIGNNIVPAACFLIGGLAGTMAMKDIRKRSQLLKAGIIVGEAQFFAVVGLGLVFGIGVDVFLREGFLSLFSGIIAAFFTLGLLPILEHSFKITTNIHLLELSDLNHPLLKEVLIKAPGTYHHSLIMSSLAEQAAEAIGANPLLARVGAYFHDIGKLEKPEYFSENQSKERRERSKHDKLSPSMSSLIITNHVKKGLELAHKHKLPPAIIDFIEQHHGMSLVYYFYHKALEVKSEEEIKEEQFRYPGPKPQTKEVALVSLADAVEAATRSLQEPTSARIKGLIKEIIHNKFEMGELDECELTLKDLNKIADVFTRLSVSIHHTRVEYPSEKKED
ncbi:MAG: HDIG domain-containing protein [Candidatus Saelkia tenebricola]|nr:HDIG domain-containing protein [Candidatus Saelkia tenebricola]